jgi:hypothetical protein
LLRRALTPAGPYTNLFPVGVISFADTNVTNGKTYYYQASATNALGGSAWSSPVSAFVPLPILSAAASNSTLVVSWPLTASSYSLACATNLSPPVTWTAVTNAPVTTNGSSTVIIVPGGTEQFYRLK